MREVVAIRDSIREAGRALKNSDLLEKFNDEVLIEFNVWETKVIELCGLAQKYHGFLDQQSSNFQKVKIIISEKDQLIAELHDQLSARDVLHHQKFAELRSEL